MKLSNKLPRTLSIVAAVLLLLLLISGFIANILNWRSMLSSAGATVVIYIVMYLLTSLPTVFCVVALLRGKRDALAGVLLVLGAVISTGVNVISGITSTISYFSTRYMLGDMFGALVGSKVFSLICALVTAIFYVLLAIACFKPGKFCTSKGKVMLFFLPVVIAILSSFSSIVIQLPAIGADVIAVAVSVVSMLLGNLISHVPILLLGIAFATPVYEKDPYAGYPASPYPNV